MSGVAVSRMEVRINDVAYVPVTEVRAGRELARALAAEWRGDGPVPPEYLRDLRVHVTDGPEGCPLEEVVARLLARLSGEVE